MAQKEKLLLTIDIGENNLRMAEFLLRPGFTPELTKFAFRRMDKQVFENTFAAEFAEAYSMMLVENGFTAEDVRISISAHNAFLRLSKLPMTAGENADKVIEFEASQAMPYHINEVDWDYQLLRRQWVERTVGTNADGEKEEFEEYHEDLEALFVAVKSEQIAKFTDVIIDSGKRILSVDISPLALFNAAKITQAQGEECVLLLNIGCRSTSLMIVDGERAFIRSIPVAGLAMTTQIAKEFGVPMDEAEDLKRKHGFVALGGAYAEPESELAATISKIARVVMTRLHGEISRSVSMWKAQHGGRAPVRCLVSGGTSTMNYVQEFLQEKLGMPVEFLNAFGAIVIGDTIDKNALQLVAPMSQEMIGMVLRENFTCPIDISLLPRVVKTQRDIERRSQYFYASAAVLVFCFFVLLIGLLKLNTFEGALVEGVKKEVAKVAKNETEVDAIANEMNEAKSGYDEAMKQIESRKIWSDVVTELQTLMPDGMWLVGVECLGEEQEGEAQSVTSSTSGMFSASGEGGEIRVSPEVLKKINKASQLTEAKRLRIDGYTFDFQGEKQLVDKLKKALEKSKFFTEEVKNLDYRVSGSITKFSLILNFKEAVRK